MIPKAMRLDPEASDFDMAVINSINRELLKYAASKQMFCKNCNRVLDWASTVIIDIEKEPQKATVIVCDRCFKPEGVATLEEQGFTVEITKKR